MSGRAGAVVIGCVLAAGAALALLFGERLPDPIQTGRTAPGFTLPVLGDGAPVSLESLRGEVVLVNFWATWCKPCEDEMPAMERLYRALAPQGFELLAVSVDTDREAVEGFRGRMDLSFPILMDPDRRVSQTYQSFRFPESYLIDREGTLVARFIGPRDWDAPLYTDRIRKLLGIAPGSSPGSGSGR